MQMLHAKENIKMLSNHMKTTQKTNRIARYLVNDEIGKITRTPRLDVLQYFPTNRRVRRPPPPPLHEKNKHVARICILTRKHASMFAHFLVILT